MNKRAILKETISKIADNTIFSVKFIKATNGKERLMTCRLGVGKYANPNSRGLSDKQIADKEKYNKLTVIDMDVVKKANIDLETATIEELVAVRPYRDIICDNILELKLKGVHIKRESLQDETFTFIDKNI